MIKAAQRLGFSLDEVAALLETGRHRHGRKGDEGLQASAAAKLVEVQQRITDLQVIAGTLEAVLAAGCET